jgi:hypothetical protein
MIQENLKKLQTNWQSLADNTSQTIQLCIVINKYVYNENYNNRRRSVETAQ